MSAATSVSLIRNVLSVCLLVSIRAGEIYLLFQTKKPFFSVLGVQRGTAEAVFWPLNSVMFVTLETCLCVVSSFDTETQGVN